MRAVIRSTAVRLTVSFLLVILAVSAIFSIVGINVIDDRMYFTQLLSLALGSSPKQAGIGREVVPLEPVVACAARAG